MRSNENESGLSLYLVELFWAYFERKFIAPISANNKWNQFKSKFCIWIIYDIFIVVSYYLTLDSLSTEGEKRKPGRGSDYIFIEQLSEYRIVFCEHSS